MEKLTSLYNVNTESAADLCDVVDAAAEFMALVFRARYMIRYAKTTSVIVRFENEVTAAWQAVWDAWKNACGKEQRHSMKHGRLLREVSDAYYEFKHEAEHTIADLWKAKQTTAN